MLPTSLPARAAVVAVTVAAAACADDAPAPRGTGARDAVEAPETLTASLAIDTAMPTVLPHDTMPPKAVPAEEDVVVEGVVGSFGGVLESVTVIETADGPFTVRGDYTAELRRLSGATVRAEGSASVGFPERVLRIRAYQVLAIDGERPTVGVLLLRDGDVWLRLNADSLRLTGAPDALAGLAGAKVWVIGRRSDATLAVGSYGVIRP
jgi:hypothetical protein